MTSIPVLLITFNRPEHTRKVLESVLKSNTLDLYVFQDGARVKHAKDIEKCVKVRQVVENVIIGSRIHLHTLYSECNLGCGPGPMTAMNWFFSENEMGIIIS